MNINGLNPIKGKKCAPTVTGYLYNLRVNEALHSLDLNIISKPCFYKVIDNTFSPRERLCGRMFEKVIPLEKHKLLAGCSELFVTKVANSTEDHYDLMLTRISKLLFKIGTPVPVHKLRNLYISEYKNLTAPSEEVFYSLLTTQSTEFLIENDCITTKQARHSRIAQVLLNNAGPFGLCMNCLKAQGINDYSYSLYNPDCRQNMFSFFTDMKVICTEEDSVDCLLLWTFFTVTAEFLATGSGSARNFEAEFKKAVTKYGGLSTKTITFDKEQLTRLAVQMFINMNCPNSRAANISEICPHLTSIIECTHPEMFQQFVKVEGIYNRYIHRGVLPIRVSVIETQVLRLLAGYPKKEAALSEIIEKHKQIYYDSLIDWKIWNLMANIKMKSVKGKCYVYYCKSEPGKASVKNNEVKKDPVEPKSESRQDKVCAVGNSKSSEKVPVIKMGKPSSPNKASGSKNQTSPNDNLKKMLGRYQRDGANSHDTRQLLFDRFSNSDIKASFHLYLQCLALFVGQHCDDNLRHLRIFFSKVREVASIHGHCRPNEFSLFEQLVVRMGLLCITNVTYGSQNVRALDGFATQIYLLTAGSRRVFTRDMIAEFYEEKVCTCPKFPTTLSALWHRLKEFNKHFEYIEDEGIRPKCPYIDTMYDFIGRDGGCFVPIEQINFLYTQLTGIKVSTLLNFYPKYVSTYRDVSVSKRELEDIMCALIGPIEFEYVLPLSAITESACGDFAIQRGSKIPLLLYQYQKLYEKLDRRESIHMKALARFATKLSISKESLDWILEEMGGMQVGEMFHYSYSPLTEIRPVLTRAPVGSVVCESYEVAVNLFDGLIVVEPEEDAECIVRLPLTETKLKVIFERLKEILADAGRTTLNSVVDTYTEKYGQRPFLSGEWHLLQQCKDIEIQVVGKDLIVCLKGYVAEKNSRQKKIPVVVKDDEVSPEDERVRLNILSIMKQLKTASVGTLAFTYKEKFRCKVPTGNMKLSKYLRRIPFLEIKEVYGAADMIVSLVEEEGKVEEKNEDNKPANTQKSKGVAKEEVRKVKNCHATIYDILTNYPDGITVSTFTKLYRKVKSRRLVHTLSSDEAFLQSLNNIEISGKFVRLISPPNKLTFEDFEKNIINILKGTTQEFDYITFCDLYKTAYGMPPPGSRCFEAENLAELFYMSTKVSAKAAEGSALVHISLVKNLHQSFDKLQSFVLRLIKEYPETLTLSELKESYNTYMKSLGESLDFQTFFTNCSRLFVFFDNGEEYVRLRDMRVRPCQPVINRLVKASCDSRSKPARTLLSNSDVIISNYGFQSANDFIQSLDDLFVLENGYVSLKARRLPDCLKRDILDVIRSIRGDLSLNEFEKRFQEVCGYILRPKALGFKNWREILSSKLNDSCVITASDYVRQLASASTFDNVSIKDRLKRLPELVKMSPLKASAVGDQPDVIPATEKTEAAVSNEILCNIIAIIFATERIGFPDELADIYEQTFDVKLDFSRASEILYNIMNRIPLNVICDGAGKIILIPIPDEAFTMYEAATNTTKDSKDPMYNELLTRLANEYQVPEIANYSVSAPSVVESIVCFVDDQLL